MATVGGEDASKDAPKEVTIDIHNRDPEHINDHLKVSFQEIFAEPHPTVFSFDKVWTLSYTVFSQTKLWCYRILSLLCAIPCSFCWGCLFAYLSFCNIWAWVPCLRMFSIKLFLVKKVFEPCMDAFFVPCYSAIGHIFANIRVTMIKG